MLKYGETLLILWKKMCLLVFLISTCLTIRVRGIHCKGLSCLADQTYLVYIFIMAKRYLYDKDCKKEAAFLKLRMQPLIINKQMGIA